ncbi:MAG: MFS transporter [Geminicoccaceae bacterium]
MPFRAAVGFATGGRPFDGRRWPMLAILCTAIVLSMTTWFSATAVVPELTALFQLSSLAVSLLTIAVQVGFVLGAVGSSLVNLPDLAPLHVLMSVAAAGAAVANATILIAPDASAVILARLVTGVCLAGVYPPAMKLVATWFRTNRGLALGAVIAAITLGSALPHLIRASGGVGWATVVGTASAATLLGAALIGGVVREGPFPFQRAVFDPRQIGQALRNRAVLLSSLGYFGHMWELYAMWGWFLAYARDALTTQSLASGTTASLLTFAVIAIGSVGCVLAGLLSDRWGRTATAMAMLASSGLCALLIGFSFDGPLWLFIAITLVWGMTVVGDSAQFSAIVTEAGDPRYVGTALTLQMGLGFMLTVVTIWLLPAIVDSHGGWRWVFLVLVPGPVLGVAAMATLRRLPEARRLAGGRR